MDTLYIQVWLIFLLVFFSFLSQIASIAQGWFSTTTFNLRTSLKNSVEFVQLAKNFSNVMPLFIWASFYRQNFNVFFSTWLEIPSWHGINPLTLYAHFHAKASDYEVLQSRDFSRICLSQPTCFLFGRPFYLKLSQAPKKMSFMSYTISSTCTLYSERWQLRSSQDKTKQY